MSGTPEYLESHAGSPAQTGGRRSALIFGGAVGLVAVACAGAWAAWSFLATGPQPAEALPDTTVAYLSVDLDPSGGQKIEALRALTRFPAFEEQLGLDAEDDIRERIFEEIQPGGTCDDLDFNEDVDPWLGDRFAVAGVDTGEDTPVPVVVLQVDDEDGADDGLGALRDCGGDLAWAVQDGWALVGESQDVVDDVAADAASAPLSDDDDYQKWTGETGDAGIATAYVSPAAGPLIADTIADAFGLPGDVADEAAEEAGGLAATLRFADGGVELAVAGRENDELSGVWGGAGAGESVAELPDDTAAAIAVSFGEGWLDTYLDQVGSTVEDQLGMSLDDLLAEGSRETGLDLPEDIETLLGDATVLAVGADLDLESAEGPEDVPVVIKVSGDPDAVERVLDKVRPQSDPGEEFLGSVSEGDAIVVGPDGAFRAEVLEGGTLGDEDTFRDVVPEPDSASYVVFADLDAADGLLDQLTEEEPDSAEFVANVRPLSAFGFSTWVDGDVARMMVKITTD